MTSIQEKQTLSLAEIQVIVLMYTNFEKAGAGMGMAFIL